MRFASLDRDLAVPKTGRNGRHPLPSPEDAARTFGRLGVGVDTQVVAYDGGSSTYPVRLWWMLRVFVRRRLLPRVDTPAIERWPHGGDFSVDA